MSASVRSTVAAMVVAASAAMVMPSAASAFTVFFGEDVNNSESTPLGAFPNATAAEAAFGTAGNRNNAKLGCADTLAQ